MNYLLHLFLFCLIANELSFSGVALAEKKVPLIGFLRCYEPLPPISGYDHLFYFEKDGEWKEFSRIANTSKLNVRPTFDGNAFEAIEVKSKQTILKTVSEKINTTCNWLKKRGRRPIVLTTTSAKFSDPDLWKPSNFESLRITEQSIQSEVSGFKGCQKPSKMVQGKLFKHFKLGRSYQTKNYDRALIELVSTCQEIKDDVLDVWSEGSNPWSIWIFRDNNGKLTKKMNLDLIDIGDFDEDGKSEGVFFTGNPVPQGEYAIIDLRNFSQLAIAHDDGR